MSDAPGAPAIRRMNISADLERYTRWSREEQAKAQSGLKDVLRSAAAATGLPIESWYLQPAGDAELAVLPPGIDEGEVIREFPRALRRRLYEVNRGVSERVRLRMRVAMHVGITALGDMGFVGAAPIAVTRMRDSAPVREAMELNPDADFALVISEVLHEDHLGHLDHEYNMDTFRRIEIDIPSKGYRGNAFLYVPPTRVVAGEPGDSPVGKEPEPPAFVVRHDALLHEGDNITLGPNSSFVRRDQYNGTRSRREKP
ncbi:hypothetical protein KIH74_21325 [Kineosporia sp. J2-2]|uniref:Uncharacterized protein n=1 Tax=Kineosporia corallincola TaxID=2835133 RepID=A0ABS5TN57_9ACTN|nr:hypothetical protein [Kineosporia corallincola]MBT0771493.1 hypothetical protein [Kineosporia corallincola]